MTKLLPPALRRALIRRRLRATMRPDPEYREHRLAQFTPQRRERYWHNVGQAGKDTMNERR